MRIACFHVSVYINVHAASMKSKQHTHVFYWKFLVNVYLPVSNQNNSPTCFLGHSLLMFTFRCPYSCVMRITATVRIRITHSASRITETWKHSRWISLQSLFTHHALRNTFTHYARFSQLTDCRRCWNLWLIIFYRNQVWLLIKSPATSVMNQQH